MIYIIITFLIAAITGIGTIFYGYNYLTKHTRPMHYEVLIVRATVRSMVGSGRRQHDVRTPLARMLGDELLKSGLIKFTEREEKLIEPPYYLSDDRIRDTTAMVRVIRRK